MNIALMGCGYVADFYMATLKFYPEINLVGVYDINQKRQREFQKFYSVKKGYASFEELLNDPAVELVLNLTNPRVHYETNRQCLEAGKHVYSEKPLAMDYNNAAKLVQLARAKKLYLSSAPCSLLGETAQTIFKALNEGVIGDVRLIYGSFDSDMITKYNPWSWQSASGALWPAKDEFEVGCTYEHAGYILTWLAAFFGPAKSVTAFASTQIEDKGIAIENNAPDFTVGCIEYGENIVARVTCSNIAPLDKSLTIIGDRGIIYVKNVRDDASPVYVKKLPSSRIECAFERRINFWWNRVEHLLNWFPWSWGRHFRCYHKYPLVGKPKYRTSGKHKPVDFCRGLSEMVHAIQDKRSSRLSAELGLHIVEMIEALQYPEKFNGKRSIESAFDPILPLYMD